MKNFIYIISILTVIGCSSGSEKKSALIGHWSMCHRDGRYVEQINNEKEFIVLDQDSILNVAIYRYWMENDSVYGVGLTDNTIRIDTFKFHVNVVSDNKIILSNQYGKYDLHKIESQLEEPSDEINSGWIKNAYSGFDERRTSRNCADLRTEEEKEPPPFGHVEDEFEDLIDFEELEKTE